MKDNPLSSHEQRLLELYRNQRVPSSKQQQASFDVVKERIAAGDAGPELDLSDSSSPDPTPSGGAASTTTFGSVGKVLMAAAGTSIVAGGVWLSLAQEPRSDSNPQPNTVVQPSRGVLPHAEHVNPVTTSSPRASAMAIPQAEPSTIPPSAEPPTPGQHKPTTRKQQTSPSSVQTRETPPATATPPSTLKQELVLLRRGQTALNSGDLPSALRAFEQHRAQFPGGALAQERELKRISVLCKLGRQAEAQSAAQRFAAQRPGSAAAKRAQKLCGAKP